VFKVSLELMIVAILVFAALIVSATIIVGHSWPVLLVFIVGGYVWHKDRQDKKKLQQGTCPDCELAKITKRECGHNL
jgi:hypothetical protein